MKNINIIANNVVLLSEHIIEKLKCVEDLVNFKNVISDIITNHKSYIGLEKYYLYSPNNEWQNTFYMELTFYGRSNVITLKFSNTAYPSDFRYKASVEKYVIIVTQPLYSYIEGIIYCGNEPNYLYIDQFSNRLPIRPRKIVINDVIYGNQDRYGRIECSDFISFYERLNDVEKKQIVAIDVDLSELNDGGSIYVDYVRRMIVKGNITCVIKPNTLARVAIDKLRLNDRVKVISRHDKLFTLTKEQWIRKTLSAIENYYYNNYTGNDCYNSIINVIIDYELSGAVISKLILEVFDTESIMQHRLEHKLDGLKSIL